MKTWNLAAMGALAIALTACGGSAPATPANPASAQTPVVQSNAVATQFTISVPKSSSSANRAPQYVGAGVKSVTITLNTVNGGAAPAGLTTSVTTNITLPCAPCTVPGPSVPPGSDNFTITTYDALGAGGNQISTGSPTLAIAAGTANSNTITLDGIPKSFTITGVPAAIAGTAFGAPITIVLKAEDADLNQITGTYASTVTLTDSDTSSLTQGSSLAKNGGSGASSVTTTSSNDTFTMNYGGLAIEPAMLTASASGASDGTAAFAPALSPIVYTGPTVSALPEIDLYATSGTGSNATFTATEVGWTNSPYSRLITATESAGCNTIATTAYATGTFTTSVAASPAVGTCTMILSDFIGGNTKDVTLTYTTSGFGID